MNFIAKQVLKSKTGALTDKLDEVSKKCKDLLESDEPDTAPQAQNLSEEEQMKQEADRRKEHYNAFNAEREEQRNKLREKYGLQSDSSPEKNSNETGADNCSNEAGEPESKEEESGEKKDGDCCVM